MDQYNNDLQRNSENVKKAGSKALSYVGRIVGKKIGASLIAAIGWEAVVTVIVIIVLLLVCVMVVGALIEGFMHFDFIGAVGDPKLESVNQDLTEIYNNYSAGTVKNDVEKRYQLPWNILASIDMVYLENVTPSTSIARRSTDALKPIFTYRTSDIITVTTITEKVEVTETDENGNPKTHTKTVTHDPVTTIEKVDLLDKVSSFDGLYNLKYKTVTETSVTHDGDKTTKKEVTKEVYIGDTFEENYARLDGYLRELNIYNDKDLVMVLYTGDVNYNGINLPDVYNLINADFISLYKEAGKKFGVDWWILAGIHYVETKFSTNMSVSSAGAVGHMQFMPGTWSGNRNPVFKNGGNYDTNPNNIKRYGGYGIDANKDGVADPYNVEDAIFSAAYYLSENGYSTNQRKAIFAYNHADWYVDNVISAGENIRYAYEGGSFKFAYTGNVKEAKERILSSKNVLLHRTARVDIESNMASDKVILLIDQISQVETIYISSIKGNHTKYVSGTDKISLHYLGRAFDVASINGIPVISQRFVNSPAYNLAKALLDSDMVDEIGSPWDFGQKSFTDEGHQNHIHVGVTN